LLARGELLADGPTTEIKGLVGSRAIRATLPGVDRIALSALPGVGAADRRGDAVSLTCFDGDTALRALLTSYPEARDIEVASAGLEEAFLELTREASARTPELAEAIG
jgi:ABC-2 type transport system ATP-binding protein